MGQQELLGAISLNHAPDMPSITKATHPPHHGHPEVCRPNSVTGVEDSLPERHKTQGWFVGQKDVRREACAGETYRNRSDLSCQ